MSSYTLTPDEQAWFDQLLRLARDFADAHNSLSMTKFAQARANLQEHVMPSVEAARRCARYDDRRVGPPTQDATDASKSNRFLNWFVDQHGDRPGVGEPTDEFLVDVVARGKQADQILRDRAVWDNCMQSALRAWAFMRDYKHQSDDTAPAVSIDDQSVPGFVQQISAAKESFAARDAVDKAAVVSAVAQVQAKPESISPVIDSRKQNHVSTKLPTKRTKKQKPKEET